MTRVRNNQRAKDNPPSNAPDTEGCQAWCWDVVQKEYRPCRRARKAGEFCGKHKPKPETVNLVCPCGASQLSVLTPGRNDITYVCSQCQAVTNVTADYDGRGMVTIYAGNISPASSKD